MSFTGFSGCPPCVTVAYWQINVMMMMLIRDTCSLQTVGHCSFVDYGSNADAVSHYSVYSLCHTLRLFLYAVFFGTTREFPCITVFVMPSPVVQSDLSLFFKGATCCC